MKVARGSGLKSVENIVILKGQMSKTLGKMRVSKLAERIGGTAEALIYIISLIYVYIHIPVAASKSHFLHPP